MSRPVKTPYTDDVRIGVTPVEHSLLDLVEKLRAKHLSRFVHLSRAAELTKAANAAWRPPADVAAKAIEAAAHLVLAAEELGAEG